MKKVIPNQIQTAHVPSRLVLDQCPDSYNEETTYNAHIEPVKIARVNQRSAHIQAHINATTPVSAAGQNPMYPWYPSSVQIPKISMSPSVLK